MITVKGLDRCGVRIDSVMVQNKPCSHLLDFYLKFCHTSVLLDFNVYLVFQIDRDKGMHSPLCCRKLLL